MRESREGVERGVERVERVDRRSRDQSLNRVLVVEKVTVLLIRS